MKVRVSIIFELFRQFLRVEYRYSSSFESTSREGSGQVVINPYVGLLVKFKKGFGSQKPGSRYLEVGSWQEANSN
ncbi:hypothetical protein DY000_02034601 [Brassica cretica]|uniref:Uncharacterized protein n=1 Tax=Brassica cretica TaxID=69181 RepID=A0ABQ7DL40_BRACR|nr:hypothetical protein DY000_02034601 [Brassica cretica]